MNLVDSHDTERIRWTLTPGNETRADKELNAANDAQGKLRQRISALIKFTVPGPFTMTQQAQNDYYDSEEQAALDYAAAVNEEIRDLFAAGADVVQLDEPYMQARPEKARQYGLAALQRALDGIDGKTCVHICFGYAALIHERPEGYSFLPELSAARCRQVSIETGQSNLDCTVLESLGHKSILVGVLDLPDLREDLRVGRHRRPAHHQERVRALRRLRTGLCR